jgi:hypothetical protein
VVALVGVAAGVLVVGAPVGGSEVGARVGASIMFIRVYFLLLVCLFVCLFGLINLDGHTPTPRAMFGSPANILREHDPAHPQVPTFWIIWITLPYISRVPGTNTE